MTTNIHRHKHLLLLLILLLAAFGRLYHIDQESLWVDEGFSYWAIRHPHMFDLVRNDVHPPLYFVMLRGWADVAGISELALRYLSVVPSLLSVAVVYHVARELERLRGTDRPGLVPLLAALMLALADMENYIAQQTRMYTWHVLWVVLSMWLFLRWIRTNERRSLLGWIVASALLIYTQYVGLAALAVQGLVVLLFLRGRQRMTAIGALGLVGVLFLPWLALVVSGQTSNVGTGFNVPSTLESLWNFRDEWFTQQWALLMVLAVWGLIYTASDDQLSQIDKRGFIVADFLLLAWLIVPVTAAYILNYRTPILMDYRLTQITPAVALLIAFGLGKLRGMALPLLLVVITVNGVLVNDTPHPRPPWRAVGQDAAQFAEPGDLALAHVTPSGDWQVMYYYERFMPDGVETRSLRQWQLEPELYGSRYEDGLPALLADYDTVWLMHWSKDVSAFEMLAASGFVQTAVMTEDWLGNDLNVYRFDRPPDETAALATYDNGLVLRDAVVPGDELQIDLWWSTDRPSDGVDYTVSVHLLAADGRLMAQHDAGPFNNQRPTSGIQPGELVYDPHVLNLVEGIDTLPPGEYTVSVVLYQWTAEGIITQATTDGAESVQIGTVRR